MATPCETCDTCSGMIVLKPCLVNVSGWNDLKSIKASDNIDDHQKSLGETVSDPKVFNHNEINNNRCNIAWFDMIKDNIMWTEII